MAAAAGNIYGAVEIAARHHAIRADNSAIRPGR